VAAGGRGAGRGGAIGWDSHMTRLGRHAQVVAGGGGRNLAARVELLARGLEGVGLLEGGAGSTDTGEGLRVCKTVEDTEHRNSWGRTSFEAINSTRDSKPSRAHNM
jgi:hypothetical protein